MRQQGVAHSTSFDHTRQDLRTHDLLPVSRPVLKMLFDLFDQLAGNKVPVLRYLLSHRYQAGLISGIVKDYFFGPDMGGDPPSACMGAMSLVLATALENGAGRFFCCYRCSGLPYDRFQRCSIKFL